MKRILSYSFMLLILLNVVGYNGLFFGLQYRNAAFLRAKFDSGNYKDEVAVTLRIPLSMPYAYDRFDFDRVNGMFEFDGKTYRLVEKKLERDTLTVVCVIDHRQKEIDNAFQTYIKTFQDNPGQHSSSIPVITFIKDYLMSGFSMEHGTTGWSSIIAHRERPSTLCCVSLAAIPIPPEQYI